MIKKEAMKSMRLLVVTVVTIAVSLVLMIVMFWAIDILPLVLFGIMVILYGLLSSKRNHSQRSNDSR